MPQQPIIEKRLEAFLYEKRQSPHKDLEILWQTVMQQSAVLWQKMLLQIVCNNRLPPEKTSDMLLAESKHLENCPLQEQSALLIIHLLLYPGAPYAGTVETDSMHFLQEAAPPFPRQKYRQSLYFSLFPVSFREAPAGQDLPYI